MARRTYTRRLLVEGRVEQRLIPELIERNGIKWGERRENAIVDIEEFGGIEDMLKPGVIETELKASGLRYLGILVDADEDLGSRWRSVRNRCLEAFPDEIPGDIPEEGLIVQNSHGLRLGVWIMPDNQNRGMLETFLSFLVPAEEDPVFKHAVWSVAEAKKIGAGFKDSHDDKARIHTWLAWQDPPGRQLHDAVKERILTVDSVLAERFVSWFVTLYELSREA